MQSQEHYLRLDLSEIDFMPKDAIVLLNWLNIYTLGQLLGASKGLAMTELFNDLPGGEKLVQDILVFVPEDLILEFRSYNNPYPTGLLKSKDDEKDC